MWMIGDLKLYPFLFVGLQMSPTFTVKTEYRQPTKRSQLHFVLKY